MLAPSADASARRTLLAALAVTAVVAVMLALANAARLSASLGDPDDALRLVMVRELLDGRGWYDQHLLRLQPPLGVYMHWSRLVDGGLAGLDRLFRLGLPADRAELAMRFVWPLLWIFPAVAAALSLARTLRPGAMLACALLLATSLNLYVQFLPGRIDHHNVQIALSLVAVAAAVRGASARDGIIAGGATALALAVGLESLPFLALAGAATALRFVLAPTGARFLKAYGLSLGLGAAGAFLLQTPPDRWGVSACDALGLNLCLGLAVAGAGTAASAWLAPTGGRRTRIVLLLAAGLAAAGAYLGGHPACARGPMAEIDPRLMPVWFDHVQELQPWTQYLAADPAKALAVAAAPVLGLAGAAWLLAHADYRRRPEVLLAVGCLVLAVALGLMAVRATPYAGWFAVPVLAAAVCDLGARLWARRPVRTLALAMVGSPLLVSAAGGALLAAALPAEARGPSPTSAGADDCFSSRAYAGLDRLAPARALAPTDLGPYVLAHSRLSVMGGPYHRLSFGMLATIEALQASPSAAEAKVRALDVGYVIDCPALAVNADHRRLGPASLQAALDQGRAPAWLQPLSGPRASVTVYKVRPPL